MSSNTQNSSTGAYDSLITCADECTGSQQNCARSSLFESVRFFKALFGLVFHQRSCKISPFSIVIIFSGTLFMPLSACHNDMKCASDRRFVDKFGSISCKEICQLNRNGAIHIYYYFILFYFIFLVVIEDYECNLIIIRP